MSILRKIFSFLWKSKVEGLEKELSSLKILLSEYREKEKIEKYANYIQVWAPRTKSDVDAVNDFLKSLNGNEQFLFYLNNLENIMMAEFMAGKENDNIPRGGLRIVKRIREDIQEAGKRKKDDAKQTV